MWKQTINEYTFPMLGIYCCIIELTIFTGVPTVLDVIDGYTHAEKVVYRVLTLPSILTRIILTVVDDYC